MDTHINGIMPTVLIIQFMDIPPKKADFWISNLQIMDIHYSIYRYPLFSLWISIIEFMDIIRFMDIRTLIYGYPLFIFGYHKIFMVMIYVFDEN